MKRFELVKREDHYGLYNEDGHKIAATIDGCNSKLSKENCDEIFEVVDVEDLASYFAYNQSTEDSTEQFAKFAFIEGFNKATELNNDKLFTTTNLRVGMINLLYLEKEKDELSDVFKERQFKFVDEYIQSLQQPTEIEVEIIYDRDCYSSAGWCDKLTMAQCIMCTPVYPLKDENGCLILKKL